LPRQHDERPLRRKPFLQQILPYPARALARLPVGQRAPAGAVALREEDALGRLLGPPVEALGELEGISAERVRRAQQHAAVRAPLYEELARAETHAPGRSGHDGLA